MRTEWKKQVPYRHCSRVQFLYSSLYAKTSSCHVILSSNCKHRFRTIQSPPYPKCSNSRITNDATNLANLGTRSFKLLRPARSRREITEESNQGWRRRSQHELHRDIDTKFPPKAEETLIFPTGDDNRWKNFEENVWSFTWKRKKPFLGERWLQPWRDPYELEDLIF